MPGFKWEGRCPAPVNYYNWECGCVLTEADVTNERCVALLTDSVVWNLVDCDNTYPFLCETMNGKVILLLGW